MRSEIWVYKLEDKGGLTLIPNQPFKTKREALKNLSQREKDFFFKEPSYKIT